MIYKKYLTPEQIELTEQLKGLWGIEYIRHSAKIYDSLADVIKNDAELIIKNYGKFSSIDIATIALKYNLNFKLACEFLEELEILRPGTYDKINRDKIFSVKKAMDAAKEDNGWV